jgi:hypothetical protein
LGTDARSDLVKKGKKMNLQGMRESPPICEFCDGVVVHGKCRNTKNCPQRIEDKQFHIWYEPDFEKEEKEERK